MAELVPHDPAAPSDLTILRKVDARGLVLELAGVRQHFSFED
jgi:hypothetical protein